MELLLHGKYVLTSAAEPRVLTDAAVCVSGGIVTEVGDWPTLRQAHREARVVGDGKQLLLPGLVDAHSHGRAISPIQKGVLNDYLENNLLDWAIMPPFDPELTAALGVVRHVRSGCTTIHHMGFDTEGSQAPDLRAFAEPLVNLDSTRMERDYFELFDHLYRKFNSEDTRILLSPSWAQAVTESFLARTKETADRLGKVPIHMHCLQTPIQKAFSLRRYGQTAVAWLDERGLIDEHVALGHAIWVTDRDIDILAARRASVTSHPSCNLGMRNGLAPVYEMARRGVNVALGLDDKTINDDEDAVMELRMLHKLHRVPSYDLATPPLSAREVLAMGTLNGARALGFAGRLGALTPGLKADAILVDLDRVLDDPWLTDDLDIVEAFLHRAMGDDVATAVVGGRIVMEDGRFLTLDVAALYQEVRAAARTIGDEQRRRAEMLQRLKPYYQRWYNDWQRWYNDWLGGETRPFYVLNSRV